MLLSTRLSCNKNEVKQQMDTPDLIIHTRQEPALTEVVQETQDTHAVGYETMGSTYVPRHRTLGAGAILSCGLEFLRLTTLACKDRNEAQQGAIIVDKNV